MARVVDRPAIARKSSARRRRLGLAVTACALLLPASAGLGVAAVPKLGWISGVACGSPAFDRWLGHPAKVQTIWAPQYSWQGLVRYSATLRQYAGPPRTSIGVPLLTRQDPGAFGRCAGGAFDPYFRAFARNMVGAGLGELIVRPGWEANGDWFPWSIGDDVTGYKNCFRHVVSLFRAMAPGVKIEWSMDKHGRLRPATQAYPGDAFVDYVGVSYYDRYPPSRTESEWDKQIDNYFAGGPYGIGAWLAFARSHGKKLAVPEWGISNGYRSYQYNRVEISTDNPLFISKMFRFFSAHRADIAYETYFNCDGENPRYYRIQPPGLNPLAAKRYRRLWGGR